MNRRLICLAAAIAAPLGAHAESWLELAATPKYEYNSNIFYLPGGLLVPGTNIQQHGDSYVSYGGSMKAADSFDGQQVYADVDGADVRYDRFSYLTHTEYHVSAGLKWLATDALSGAFDFTRSKTELPFSTLLVADSALAIETEQRETASVGYLINTDWRLDLSVYQHRTESPLPGTENLNLRGNAGTMGLTYGGEASLTGGMSFGYEHGHFEGGIDGAAPTYQQSVGGLVLNYAATGLSSFHGNIGYTRRTSSDLQDNVSGVTGGFEYQRKLTGKTTMDVAISRNITSNIASTGSEVDTGANFALRWQATYRLQVSVGGNYTIRYLPAQGNELGANRTDHEVGEKVALEYDALRWLKIQPYVNLRSRSSEEPLDHYNATIYGISFVGRWGKAPPDTQKDKLK